MGDIHVYWGSGSPFAWTVLMALEFKGLPYTSHVLQLSKKEQRSPEMLKLNPRGKIPVLRDGDFVVYETQAILHYLEKKFPEPRYFGTSPESTARIIQRISEFQSYLQKSMFDTVRPILFSEVKQKEADIRKKSEFVREELRVFNDVLSKSTYMAGDFISAADFVFFPMMALFVRSMEKPDGVALNLGFLPLAKTFPAIDLWMKKLAALPIYEKTYPPHWRET